jgi:SAM-dependent methyltransferase
MSMQEVSAAMMRLQATTDALAALGARLSIGDPSDVAPEILAALDDALAAVGVSDVASLEPQQRAMLAAGIRSMFAQSADILERPTREPGWSYTDPALLQGQGRGSMMMPALLATADELKDVTSLLDLGTGVGLLAIAACGVWPACTIVGIDTWKPSLDLARQNVAEAGLDARIEIREQDVRDLDDRDRFDCVWLPSFFFSTDVLDAALPKLITATKPGGWIALAHYEPPPDPLPRATSRLRTLRDGGSVLDAEAGAELLRAAGCTEVHSIPKTWPAPVGYVLGRKS